MTDENNTDTDTGTDDSSGGRPGGAPERTLAAERIERLEAQIASLSESIKAGSAQAAEQKAAKRTTEEQVQELIAAQQRTAQDLHLARVETAAAKIGARDPDVVAALVANSDNYLADIERLKTDKPYLFGAPARPAGADMNGGTDSGGKGLDDLDRHLAERFGLRK